MQDSYRKMIRQHKILFIIGLFTLVQFLILIGFGYTPYPDSQGYIICAKDSLLHNQFYPVKEQLYTLPFLWNIGAINAVALSIKLFHSVIPLLVVYTLLKSGILILLYLIARQWFGQRVAYIALLISILYPANYGEATSLLSEVPFVFLCLSGIYAYIKDKYLCAGLLLGFADYIRPIAIIFIIAIILNNIKHYKAYIKLCVCYLFVISSIGLGNYITKGQFVYKAKTGWMALAQYHWENDAEHHGIEPMSIANNTQLTYTEKDEAWRDIFIQWIKEHKKEYIRQIPIKICKTYISDNVNMCAFLGTKEKYSKYMYDSLSLPTLIKSFPHYSFAQWLTIYNLLFYYSLLIVFLFSLKYIKALSLSWSTVIVGTVFIALLGHGEARFHIPYMPFIIICVAYYIYQKYHKTSEI